MGIGDKIVKWWVQNFYATKMTKYEPGYIIGEFEHEFGHSFQRIVMLPEKCFIDIEKQVIDKYKNGSEILKKIGRMNGYNFSYRFPCPKIKQNNFEKIKKFADRLFRYGYTGLAKEAIMKKLTMYNDIVDISLSFDNYIVCRENGIGNIFKEYIFEKQFEIISSKCQGRGDNLCELNAKSSNNSVKLEFLTPNNAKYRHFNSIKPAKYSKESFETLLNSKNIEFREGLIWFKKEVQIPIVSSMLYIIEKEISCLKDGKELLYQIFYEWASSLNCDKNSSFLRTYLSVFGLGDLKVSKENNKTKLYITQFPWEDIAIEDFSSIRGLCSGLLKDTNFTKSKLEKNENNYVLILS